MSLSKFKPEEYISCVVKYKVMIGNASNNFYSAVLTHVLMMKTREIQIYSPFLMTLILAEILQNVATYLLTSSMERSPS